jgi:hypothetical protein
MVGLVGLVDVRVDPTQRFDRIHFPPARTLWTRKFRHLTAQFGDQTAMFEIARDQVILGGRNQDVWERYLCLFYPVSCSWARSRVLRASDD